MRLNESTISTLLGILVVIVVGVLIFNYFKNVGKEPAEFEELPEEIIETQIPEEGKVPEYLPKEHTVQAGNHLWAIAEQHFGSGYNWVDIAEANDLVNPDYLEAGQKLKIPEVEAKQPTRTLDDPDPITGNQYTVKGGDNLWDISVRAYNGDGYQWVNLAEVNQLPEPNHIEPGQVLTIPR